MPDSAKVPAYEPMLAAYHRAFARELRAMLDVVPIEPGQSVLDMACGDGVYSPWLAERVGPSGRVVAVDLVPEYLELARAQAAKSPMAGIVEFACAPIDALPFDDATFDAAWCAQSLYSLPEPVSALRHLARVVKPGGVVAVLEGDTLHHLILPWSIEVELSVRAAELAALAKKSSEPHKFYVGRRLRRIFREAGLVDVKARTFASDRSAPLGVDDRLYFAEVLKGVSGRVGKSLDGPVREEFLALADLGSPRFLPDDRDFAATCIDEVAWGRKPG